MHILGDYKFGQSVLSISIGLFVVVTVALLPWSDAFCFVSRQTDQGSLLLTRRRQQQQQQRKIYDIKSSIYFSSNSASTSNIPEETPGDIAFADNAVDAAASSAPSSSSVLKRHVVQGIVCREIPMDLPVVGRITILEATANSQEDLVNMALLLEDEEPPEAANTQLQRLNAGDPYGAVLWPAAWAVSRHLLVGDASIIEDKPPVSESADLLPLRGLTILELGTGTGLVSIATAMGGAKRVLATDYEEMALSLTRHAIDTFHPSVSSIIETHLLDLCEYDTTPLPPADIVIAADIMYEPKTGIAMAHRAKEALQRGSRVVVGDSPGRPGRPAFLDTLRQLGVHGATFVDRMGRTCSGPRHELICGVGSTSVSETPKDLAVAIMDLHPSILDCKLLD